MPDPGIEADSFRGSVSARLVGCNSRPEEAKGFITAVTMERQAGWSETEGPRWAMRRRI